jgi:hypothetical protein
MVWKGTGSGTLIGNTGSMGANFTITTPANVTTSEWSINVFINGTRATARVCIPLTLPGGLTSGCGGPISVETLSFTSPDSLSSYEVDFTVYATWNDASNSTGTISLPGSSSIDLAASFGPASVPALSSEGLFLTALMLAAAAVRLLLVPLNRQRS